MQKARLPMHIPLSQGRSEVTGTTGLRILRASVAGERAPHTLAALRNDRCKKEAAAMARALPGTWRAEHLFVLRQALALFDSYTVQISACAAQIEGAFSVIKPRFESALHTPLLPESPPPPRRKPHSHRKNAPEGNTRAHLLRIPGVALVAVHGMSDARAQTI